MVTVTLTGFCNRCCSYGTCDCDPTEIENEQLRAQLDLAAELIRRAARIIDPCYPVRCLDWQRDAEALLVQLHGETNDQTQ